MNYTIHRVAAFCGLRLSYYFSAILLGMSFLLLAFTDFKTASPLYILLTMAVLPSVVKAMFYSSPKAEKRENAAAFPLFCKKYKYDAINYKAMNIAYLLLFVLLAAWQISYSRSSSATFADRLPALIAACSLLTRILGVLGYRLYFRLFPLKAMR